MKRHILFAFFIALMAVVSEPQATAGAATEPSARGSRGTKVDLKADASRETDNDTLKALMFVELTRTDGAELADALNQSIAKGLALAKTSNSVRVRSGRNQTYPVYDREQRLTGWRGRGELRLESKDFKEAAALIGRLQSTLRLGQINFSVSSEARKMVESELIGEAVKAFRERAEIVRASLGASSYRIVHLAVGAGGGFSPSPLMARAAPGSDMAPPPLEAGVSRITVSVNGTIEVE